MNREVLNARSLDFGMMLQPSTMMKMCTVLPSPDSGIQFCLSLLHREITVEFLLNVRDHRTNRDTSNVSGALRDQRRDRFRFRMPLSQMGTLYRMGAETDEVVLLLSLDMPPRYFKKLDAGQTHDDSARYWSEHDAWYRQTDIVYSQASLKKSPLTLKKARPIIDLGEYSSISLNAC